MTDALHENEVRLLMRGRTTTLPTREFDIYKADAEQRGADYCHAFNAQLVRQDAALAKSGAA